jgi:hypothetical protein
MKQTVQPFTIPPTLLKLRNAGRITAEDILLFRAITVLPPASSNSEIGAEWKRGHRQVIRGMNRLIKAKVLRVEYARTGQHSLERERRIIPLT